MFTKKTLGLPYRYSKCHCSFDWMGIKLISISFFNLFLTFPTHALATSDLFTGTKLSEMDLWRQFLNGVEYLSHFIGSVDKMSKRFSWNLFHLMRFRTTLFLDKYFKSMKEVRCPRKTVCCICIMFLLVH